MASRRNPFNGIVNPMVPMSDTNWQDWADDLGTAATAMSKQHNHDIAAAIKLIDGPFKKRKMDLMLQYNPPNGDDTDHEVFLGVTICNARNSDLPIGMVEYDVCDGLPGERNEAIHFFDLDEAVAFYNRIVKIGWKKYWAKVRKKAGVVLSD